MDEEAVIPTHDRTAAKAHLLSRLHRWRNLLGRQWWLLVLGVVLGIVGQGVVLFFSAPSFVSIGRMIVSIKLSIPEGSVYTEELSNFLGTQAALMQSPAVVSRAHARVLAQRPELVAHPVALKVSVLPKTTIFVLEAIGDNPQYAQAFLQACMEEYINLKRELRERTSDTTLAGLTEEVLRLEKELRKSDEELVAFQSTNSVLLLQDQGNSAGNYLAALNQRLAALKSDYELMQSLTADQNLERQEQPDGIASLPNPVLDKRFQDGDDSANLGYLRAKQQLLLLKAEQADLGQYLRPKHPKIIALGDEIARRERLLDIYRQQGLEQLENRKSSLALQIKNLERDVKEWDAKTLQISWKAAEYQRLKANSQRIQALYERLLGTMQSLDVNKGISPESVTIMDAASAAIPGRPGFGKQMLLAALMGLAASVLLLLLLDRLDDRVRSFTELTDIFDQTLLGQIPRERRLPGQKQLDLIQREDNRHSFVEAYRNLRSSLLYMGEPEQRPCTILITSAVPNEGKSFTAANLAITMANAGSKVLLVDGDLRKGTLHERFDLQAQPGLAEALGQVADRTENVRPTDYPNLSVLPRGNITLKASELFIGPAMKEFLEVVAARYDYVIVDSVPVMAADDVTSLAPHVNGVIFVLRADVTSARVARAALELLYQRRTKMLGLVFNAVPPTAGDYYYYYHKYKDYYKKYPTAAESAKPTAAERAKAK
jgi:succinoglycan biosynthesis transport protein ExoP